MRFGSSVATAALLVRHVAFLPTGHSFFVSNHHPNQQLQKVGKNTALFERIPGTFVPNLPNPFSGFTSDNEDALKTTASQNNPENTPEYWISQAKRALATDLLDPTLLADNNGFQWISPAVDQPLTKTDYLAAGRFFNLRQTFPDLDYRAHDFRLDGTDTNERLITVRFTCRITGTMRGALRLRDNVLAPNGNTMKCPPEAYSLTFDTTTGKVVKLATGFGLDRLVGNTEGTTGVVAAAVIGGQPVSDWELYPPATVVSRFFGRPTQPLEETTNNFLAPFPETVMITLAKGIMATNMGADDASLLADDFTYCTLTKGPIRRTDYLEKYARSEFPAAVSLNPRNYRVDPYDPRRVWVDVFPTAPGYQGAPQALSFAFDVDGYCTRITAGAVLDSTLGNGLPEPEGFQVAQGQGGAGLWNTRPIPRILGRSKASLLSLFSGERTSTPAAQQVPKAAVAVPAVPKPKAVAPKPPAPKPPVVVPKRPVVQTPVVVKKPSPPKTPAPKPAKKKQPPPPKPAKKKQAPPPKPPVPTPEVKKSSPKPAASKKKTGPSPLEQLSKSIEGSINILNPQGPPKPKPKPKQIPPPKPATKPKQAPPKKAPTKTAPEKKPNMAVPSSLPLGSINLASLIPEKSPAEKAAERKKEQERKARLAKRRAEEQKQLQAEKKRSAQKRAEEVAILKKQELARRQAKQQELKAKKEQEQARKAAQEEDRRTAARVAKEQAQERARQQAMEAKREQEERKREAAEKAKRAEQIERQAAAEGKKAAQEKERLEQLQLKEQQKKAAAALKKKEQQEEAVLAKLSKSAASATISLFGFGKTEEAESKASPSRSAPVSRSIPVSRSVPVTAKAKPSKTEPLFFATSRSVPVAKKSMAPRGVPTLKGWRKNFNGSISGQVSGAKGFEEGEKITTSPIAKGTVAKGEVVTTGSGSRYYLS